MTDEDGKIIGLMPEQQARALALKEARSVLVKNTPFGGAMAPDAMDIYNLAEYILTGEDPWAGLNFSATLESTESPPEAVAGGGPGTATEAFRTDPEIAVNAVLDSLRIEVGQSQEIGMVRLSSVLQAIEDARPVPDWEARMAEDMKNR